MQAYWSIVAIFFQLEFCEKHFLEDMHLSMLYTDFGVDRSSGSRI